MSLTPAAVKNAALGRLVLSARTTPKDWKAQRGDRRQLPGRCVRRLLSARPDGAASRLWSAMSKGPPSPAGGPRSGTATPVGGPAGRATAACPERGVAARSCHAEVLPDTRSRLAAVPFVGRRRDRRCRRFRLSRTPGRDGGPVSSRLAPNRSARVGGLAVWRWAVGSGGEVVGGHMTQFPQRLPAVAVKPVNRSHRGGAMTGCRYGMGNAHTMIPAGHEGIPDAVWVAGGECGRVWGGGWARRCPTKSCGHVVDGELCGELRSAPYGPWTSTAYWRQSGPGSR